MSGETSSEPKLLNLFVFNASYGQKEGQEHEKILFYHPSSTDLDTQVRHVGLAEAITRFSSTFKKDGDCEGVHTQKTRQVFYQPEPHIWMVMTVSIGWVCKVREAGPVREYQSEGVQDPVLQAQLATLYHALTFRYASFAALLASSGLPGLRSTLNSFFTEYISCVELSAGDVLAVWRGVSFLPLDRQTFLRTHCFLSLLQATFPALTHTAFFYNNQVVWCGMGLEDLRALSRYLTKQLLPGSTHSSQTSSSSSSSTHSNYLSRFVGEGPTPNTRIHLRDGEGHLQPHHLLVYVLAGAIVCLTLPEREVLMPSMYVEMDRQLEPEVSLLASDIGEQTSRRGAGVATGDGGGLSSSSSSSSSSGNFRYVYHNHMNLATKTTVHPPTHQALPQDVMRTITDMHSDMQTCGSGEMVVKTSLDHWVVGRCRDGREFYVVVSHRNANLVEVTDEVNRMCASHFSNIFMVE